MVPDNDARQSQLGAETGMLVEVEDIRDELSILKMVLEDQKRVLEKMTKAFELSGIEVSPLEHNRVLESHLYRIKKMETVADRTSKMVSQSTSMRSNCKEVSTQAS